MKNPTRQTRLKKLFIGIIPLSALIFALLYIMVRTVLFLFAAYHWYEKIFAFLLLLAEGFIVTHGIGYLLEHFRVKTHKLTAPGGGEPVPRLESFPPVAVIVSSYQEPLDVLEKTLVAFYNLSYPNTRIYFLDDTRYELPAGDPGEMAAYRSAIDELCRRIGVNLFRRRWHGAKAGMINDFLAFGRGEAREGFEFQNFSGKEGREPEKYIVVFDADMQPFPNFIENLVARMEANPKLAFIQTPQYYSNFEANRISRAAGAQQSVFYEHICEGKALQDAMFCCGTNVIFRREALLDVGGFDETSVTEDFATSLRFHLRGWSSDYSNRVAAFGMGPEDLGGYFKQQFRWALGTVGLFRTLVGYFLKNPRLLTTARWWEYLLSSTYYFVGLAFFILVICPITYLFFSVPSYFARPEIYILLFIPYITITLFLFWGSLRELGYRFRDIVIGQLLGAVTFPVYLKASLLALIGVKGSFGVTPKAGTAALPLRRIWAQVGLAALTFSAIVWGANRLLYERQPAAAIAVNMFWCLYHLCILSTIFYFNRPEKAGNPG